LAHAWPRISREGEGERSRFASVYSMLSDEDIVYETAFAFDWICRTSRVCIVEQWEIVRVLLRSASVALGSSDNVVSDVLAG
jgi:hypothetical protein